MVDYARVVRDAFTSYMNALQTISCEVRSIGGYGTVHGCIVDIDLFAHIYLDPLTGDLRYYYAEDVSSRHEYARLESLLAAL